MISGKHPSCIRQAGIASASALGLPPASQYPGAAGGNSASRVPMIEILVFPSGGGVVGICRSRW